MAPYPAGLNDCLSGLKWLHANAAALAIDSTRIIVAGESGGVGLAGLIRALADPEARKALGLGAQSRIFVINTEGATDPLRYAELVA